MGFLKERVSKYFDEKEQKHREKWEKKLEAAAKRRTPVEIEIYSYSEQGEFQILVNNRTVTTAFDRTAARSQEKLIRSLLEKRGYEVL